MNKILFEDFTNLYKRWNKGKERKEDRFESNISEMKQIDLGSNIPVLFSDRDLIIDGNNKFNYNEIENIITKIEKTGWRLPTYEEIQKIFYRSNQPPSPRKDLRYDWIPKVSGEIYSLETNETLIFKTDSIFSEQYWCGLENDNSKNARGFVVGDTKDYFGCMVRTNNFPKTNHLKIRLIKDK